MNETKKAALAAVPFLVMANLALAAEPVQLTDQQLDGVTASGAATASALAMAIGNPVATATAVLADVRVVSSFSAEVTTINAVLSTSTAQSASAANRPLP
jgi:hypothetical protein